MNMSAGARFVSHHPLGLQLGDALSSLLGGAVQLKFESGTPRGDTARVRNAREREERQAGAEQGFASDPDIQRLMQVHGAQIVPDSIRPLDPPPGNN